MTKLPDKLTRNAVKRFFTKVPSAKWDYWFRHEKKNGLFEIRVPGPFDRAYYSGQGVKEWLLTEAIYGPEDFEPDAAVPGMSGGWSGLSVRRHAMAG